MCFQVYLGSYTECPEIPYVEPLHDLTPSPKYTDRKLYVQKHPENSGFLGSVTELTTPYQYHLGIQSCGCGFSLNHPPDQGAGYYAHRQLGDYLGKCVERSQPVQLLSFWEGDHDKPVEHHRSITYDELYSTEFYFLERQLTLVYKDEESLNATQGIPE